MTSIHIESYLLASSTNYRSPLLGDGTAHQSPTQFSPSPTEITVVNETPRWKGYSPLMVSGAVQCPESIRDRKENTHCSLSNVSVAHSRENVTKAWRNWIQRRTFAVHQSSFTTAWALRFWRGRELSILLWTALSPAPPLLSPGSRPRTILQGSQLGYTFLTAQWLSNLIWNNLFESFFIKIQME